MSLADTLAELVALLAISVLIAYLCYRIRLVPIVGFLLAGVLIGPGLLALVRSETLIYNTAQIGVILLLFTIGVEFKLEQLRRIWRELLIGGGLQVGLCTLVVLALLVGLGVEVRSALFTGFLVAVGSSTAIVLSVLSDRQETDTVVGRLALAMLIFQDLATVAVVLLIPVLGEGHGSFGQALLALGQALLVVGGTLFLARSIMPPLLERIARTRRHDLFLLTIVAICFGMAWITHLFGVSLALGAFLAGLVVSESPYSEYALSEILPLKSVFNAVFFVSVGLLLDVHFLLAHPLLVAATALAVLLVKVLTTAAATRLLGYPLRVALVLGLALAQIGEFSFVLAQAGQEVGLTPAGLGEVGTQSLLAAIVLLMAATPLLMAAGRQLNAHLLQHPREHAMVASATKAALEDHVIVVGYGPAGQRLVQVLKDTGIPFIIIDLNPYTVQTAQKNGLPVLYGDASRRHILEHAAVDRAKVCVVAINDDAATRRIVELARYLNPTLQIIVRTRFLRDVEFLQRIGADIVVPEELETAVRIFTQVLQAYFVPPEEINRQIATIRAGDYRIFRGSIQEAHLMVLQGLDEEGLHTRAVVVRESAPVAGKTLAELNLRQRYGLTVLAVRRGERTIGSPSGDFRIEPGDRLVLIGLADQFARCAELFRPPRPSAAES
ncbi:monovalent cation:proton antiporter family protein [Rhodothermus bifroesti]|uniref:monovalent cation:proton antiporter family protein n=1 Tax=Rhodothermus bifroesti TaxID=2823335 RepID=UPI001AEF36C9|nr:monovalent cation:proton antiporter family protein [Rhodothermus bifroesti]